MKKYNLLFDGTILANDAIAGVARSGIFTTAKNIFNEILKRGDLNVSLYCEFSKCAQLKQFLEKYNFPENLEIINFEEYKKIYSFKNFCRSLKNNCDKKKHPVKRFLINFLYAFSSFILYPIQYIHTNKLRTKVKDIDFYFSPYRKTPKFIKKQKHILTSVYLHDTIPLLFYDYRIHFFSGGNWFKALIKTIGKDDIYFANSECTKHDFLRFFKQLSPEQITVVPLAASEIFVQNTDTEKLKSVKNKYDIPEGKKYIFSLCTLEPRKNLIRAIKTFIEFIKKNNIDDLVFVLGGGQWDTFIEKLAQEVNDLDAYKDKIIRAGYIDDEDLPVLYSSAEWFVYTSKYEGFGLPPLEAMSCGCPVITSNTSSIPEVVGDAGIMIEWDNDEQHIEAYEKYYFNPELRKENAQKGLERAKLFSWKKCANEIVNTLIAEKGKKK